MRSCRGLISVPSHQDHRATLWWSMIHCERLYAGDRTTAQLLTAAACCQGRGFTSSTQMGPPEQPDLSGERAYLETELARRDLCLTCGYTGLSRLRQGVVSLGDRTLTSEMLGPHTPACLTFSPRESAMHLPVNEVEQSDRDQAQLCPSLM